MLLKSEKGMFQSPEQGAYWRQHFHFELLRRKRPEVCGSQILCPRKWRNPEKQNEYKRF
jgi:hypothetical protein